MSRYALTPRALDAFHWIADYLEREGWSPSLREIAAGIGIASAGHAQEYVDALERHGLIERKPGSSRQQMRLTERGKSHR